jgi:hypothetical protein
MARCSDKCKAPSKIGPQPEDYCHGCPRLPEGLSYGVANSLAHWPEEGEGKWRLLDTQQRHDVVRLSRTVANQLVKKRLARKLMLAPRMPGVQLTIAGKAMRLKIMEERNSPF